MNHLFVGAVFPFVISILIYAARRGRASINFLILTPLAMLVCATWAVLPDLPRTFGLAGFDQSISMNPIIDIFFWHYTLNLHESYSPWFNLGFVAMLATLFWAAWRELRRLETSRPVAGEGQHQRQVKVPGEPLHAPPLTHQRKP
ncbi:MAG: hypothetical protein O3B24_08530 [Verrucomicrobia bacterium]|nr:hypothetical protein [Verrucomicrobiota bacterium]